MISVSRSGHVSSRLCHERCRVYSQNGDSTRAAISSRAKPRERLSGGPLPERTWASAPGRSTRCSSAQSLRLVAHASLPAVHSSADSHARTASASASHTWTSSTDASAYDASEPADTCRSGRCHPVPSILACDGGQPMTTSRYDDGASGVPDHSAVRSGTSAGQRAHVGTCGAAASWRSSERDADAAARA